MIFSAHFLKCVKILVLKIKFFLRLNKMFQKILKILSDAASHLNVTMACSMFFIILTFISVSEHAMVFSDTSWSLVPRVVKW